MIEHRRGQTKPAVQVVTEEIKDSEHGSRQEREAGEPRDGRLTCITYDTLQSIHAYHSANIRKRLKAFAALNNSLVI
jgi:hypothetical protein